MAMITLEQVQQLVDQLSPLDQARLLAYLAPRIVGALESALPSGPGQAAAQPSTKTQAGLNTIRARFEERYRKQESTLPADHIDNRTAGTISRRPWHVEYHWGKDGEREFLGVRVSNKFVWGDDYVVIFEGGEIKELEGYQELVGPIDPNKPGDEERARRDYDEHNRRIREQLAKWGFR